MRGWLLSGIGCVLLASSVSGGCRDGQVDVLVEIDGSSGGNAPIFGDEPTDPDPMPNATGGVPMDGNPGQGEGGTIPATTGGTMNGTGGKASSGGTSSGGMSSGGNSSGGGGSGGTSGMDGGTAGAGEPGGAGGAGGAGGDAAGGAGGDDAGGDGGTSSETGGTAGISGVAGSGCGNFVVETPEECDPPLSPGCSSTCTKDACRLCEEEESKCPAIATADGRQYTFCEQLTGNAAAGPKAGIPKAQLCLDVMRCARANKCAGTVSPEVCFCGEVEDLNQCFSPSSAANGECMAEFLGAAETSNPQELGARFANEAYALATAVSLLKCDGEVCIAECVPTP